MNRGYIKFHRRVEDSRAWTRGIEYRGLLITLLEKAAYKDGFYLGEPVRRGQFGTTMQSLADELGIHRNKLIRMCCSLSEDGFCSVHNVNNRHSLITITNYDFYQGGEAICRTFSEHSANTRRTPGEQASIRNKEGKKERRKEDNTYSASAFLNAAHPPLSSDATHTSFPPDAAHASIASGAGSASISSDASSASISSDAGSASPFPELQAGSEGPPPRPEVPEEFYLTRKKRRLAGKRLQAFNRFWGAFAYPKGKAEAADAWLDIPALTEALMGKIISAAEREAFARPGLAARGQTPKWAQGWLTARRWEDEPDMDEHGGLPSFDDLLRAQGVTQ